MVYIDGLLVFRKGEFDIDCHNVVQFFGFQIVARANAVIEYSDDSIKFLKNRNVIEDGDWTGVKRAIALNESDRKKRDRARISIGTL